MLLISSQSWRGSGFNTSSQTHSGQISSPPLDTHHLLTHSHLYNKHNGHVFGSWREAGGSKPHMPAWESAHQRSSTSSIALLQGFFPHSAQSNGLEGNKFVWLLLCDYVPSCSSCWKHNLPWERHHKAVSPSFTASACHLPFRCKCGGDGPRPDSALSNLALWKH